MVNLCLVFLNVKGRCHGNQLILVKCHKHRLIPFAFFALSLKNELQYHYLKCALTAEVMWLHRVKNLVNFCLVTPEKLSSFAYLCTCNWRKSTYTSAFVVLPFRNSMEHWKADGRINSGNDQATPGINLVSFWSVYPVFTRINCVFSRISQDILDRFLQSFHRFLQLRMLGVTIANDFTVTAHVTELTTKCAQTQYALRVLRAHGLNDDALQNVFVVVARLLYAAMQRVARIDSSIGSATD